MAKRLLSLVVAMLLVLSLAPASFAADADVVTSVKNALTIEGIANHQPKGFITGALNLANSFEVEAGTASVEWTSSDAEVINPKTGSVTRPLLSAKEVTLTAKITSGSASGEKAFVVTVQPKTVEVLHSTDFYYPDAVGKENVFYVEQGKENAIVSETKFSQSDKIDGANSSTIAVNSTTGDHYAVLDYLYDNAAVTVANNNTFTYSLGDKKSKKVSLYMEIAPQHHSSADPGNTGAYYAPTFSLGINKTFATALPHPAFITFARYANTMRVSWIGDANYVDWSSLTVQGWRNIVWGIDLPNRQMTVKETNSGNSITGAMKEYSAYTEGDTIDGWYITNPSTYKYSKIYVSR